MNMESHDNMICCLQNNHNKHIKHPITIQYGQDMGLTFVSLKSGLLVLYISMG